MIEDRPVVVWIPHTFFRNIIPRPTLRPHNEIEVAVRVLLDLFPALHFLLLTTFSWSEWPRDVRIDIWIIDYEITIEIEYDPCYMSVRIEDAKTMTNWRRKTAVP